MRPLNIASSVVLTTLLLAPQVGLSQQKCGSRDDLVAVLGEKYQEHLISGGLTGPTKLLEVWRSEDGTTWTILITEANGRSCIVASGTDWVEFPGVMAEMMGA